MIDMDIVQNAVNYAGIHYRMLVLDKDAQRSEELEISFLTTFTDKGEQMEQKHPAFKRCRSAIFFFVQKPEQLYGLPNSSAFNVIWIQVDFPDAEELAESFYSDNPFCYIIFYGDRNAERMIPCLHARPIAYIKDIRSQDAVHRELLHIWGQREHRGITLRLHSRNSYYDISLKSILYCQSMGRKTFIYVNSIAGYRKDSENDPFVRNVNETDGFFSYEQNIKLDDMEEKILPFGFVRVHQSYIVNRSYVTGLSMKKNAWCLYLTGINGKTVEIPISERFKGTAKALFV